jgi:hypothetical protein
MRTTLLLAIAAASIGVTGCKWTDFDDLAGQTWVSSTEKPNVKSNDYGVAIQRGNKTGSEGRLVVIGAGQATYSELVYDANGDSTLPPTALELNSQFGIGNLDTQPLVLADPGGDAVALIVNAGGSSLLVLEGTQGALNQHQVFVTPSSVDAATYMLAPTATQNQTLVAAGEVVLGTFYGAVPNPQPKCKLTDAGTAILPKALGAFRNGASDDVIAWGTNGKLYRYDGAVFNGCPTMQEPRANPAPVATGFMPGPGSQILALSGGHILLQGHRDTSGFLQVFDAATLTPVGGSVSLAGLRSAAILDVGITQYVIAGYPTNIVDGKTAGQVLLFRVSTATGLDTAPVLTLNDAQPENNESFGRAVAAMPYHGTSLIAVAADNEIFVYFRANLTDGNPLYPETRQGR